MKIKAVFLDIGEVLLEIEWRRFADALNRPDLTQIEKIWDNKPHDLYERGQMSSEEFLLALKKQLKISQSTKEIERAWNAIIVREVPGVDAVLKKYETKTSFYGLSNTNATHLEGEINRYGIFKRFKKIFASHEMGCRKPEKEIYLKALAELGLKGEQTLFFDDKIENIEAARAVGIHAFQCVRSPETIDKIFGEYL